MEKDGTKYPLFSLQELPASDFCFVHSVLLLAGSDSFLRTLVRMDILENLLSGREE